MVIESYNLVIHVAVANVADQEVIEYQTKNGLLVVDLLLILVPNAYTFKQTNLVTHWCYLMHVL